MSNEKQGSSGFEVWLIFGGFIAVIAVIVKGLTNVAVNHGNYGFLYQH